MQPQISNKSIPQPVESRPANSTPENTAKRARTAPGVRKALLLGSSTLLLLIVLAYTFRGPLLTIPARFLVIDQVPQPADIIVVLNGGESERATRASQLLNQGLAPRIVIAKAEESRAVSLGLAPNITDVAVGVITSLGVPQDSISVLTFELGVTSTRDEAVATRQYVEEHRIESIILVTSAFHTRRARWMFRKELRNSGVALQVVAAPHHGFDETNWWKSEEGLVYLNKEFIKLFYYIMRY